MGNQKHTISLNGKLYDTTTGGMLASRGDKKDAGKVLDGFFSGSKSPVQVKIPKPTPKTHAAAPRALRHRTQKSKTLARQAVKKPAPKQSSKVSPALLSASAIKERGLRARGVTKSNLVSRFGTFASPVVKKTASLPVRKHPLEKIEHHQTQPIANSHSGVSQSPADEIFNAALGSANSHQQTRPAKTGRRQRLARKFHVSSKIVSVSTVLMTALLLIGFFTYQNIASINVKLASAKSSVPGVIPGYKPTGFSLSRKVGHSPGQIVLNFNSTSDDRKYQITQQTSNWNSDTLLTSFVKTNRRQEQTIENNGKTIYIYDDNNATWVDGGVWYKINGNNALSSQQLLKVANSM